jgi:hypothetical protein
MCRSSSLRIADHLKLDAVVVIEIEAAAGFVIGVIVGLVPAGLDPLFGGIEIVDDDGDVIEPAGCGSCWPSWPVWRLRRV